ncbi:MAG: hypothetical protein ACOX3T_06420 [Bdellovibrionota bacterium]
MSEFKRYKIAFFAPTALPFCKDSLDLRPLDGLESNIILLSKRVSKNGAFSASLYYT